MTAYGPDYGRGSKRDRETFQKTSQMLWMVGTGLQSVSVRLKCFVSDGPTRAESKAISRREWITPHLAEWSAVTLWSRSFWGKKPNELGMSGFGPSEAHIRGVGGRGGV